MTCPVCKGLVSAVECGSGEHRTLLCGYFAPCEQDADHDGPHTAGMYPEWQVPVMEPMAFTHPAVEAAPPIDVERLRRAYCLVKHGGEHGHCDSWTVGATAAAYDRLSGEEGS